MGMSDVTDAGAAATAAPAEEKAAAKQPQLPAQVIQNEAKVRFDAAVDAQIGFAERLVWFWSNHFCISADKIGSVAGAYEREAIRPHVLGRFADMLTAVESHPAMLFYLDNVESMGANSVAGINRDKGLNENLAREILELHTLGVRSGYSQADVTSFANVLTGWTWIGSGEPTHGGEFVFVKRLHEPGEQAVLGKRYADTGVEQGRAVLADLARHPATAEHIATKTRAPFRRRRAAADAGRQTGKNLPRYRRRPQGSRQDADHGRRESGRRSAPSSSRLRNGSSASCTPPACIRTMSPA